MTARKHLGQLTLEHTESMLEGEIIGFVTMQWLHMHPQVQLHMMILNRDYDSHR